MVEAARERGDLQPGAPDPAVSPPLHPTAVTTLMVGISDFCAGTSVGVAPIVAVSGRRIRRRSPRSAAAVSAAAHRRHGWSSRMR